MTTMNFYNETGRHETYGMVGVVDGEALASRVLWRGFARSKGPDELEFREADRLDRFPLVFRARPGGAVGPRAVVDRDRAPQRRCRAPTAIDMDLRAAHETDEIGVHPHAPNTGYLPLAC